MHRVALRLLGGLLAVIVSFPVALFLAAEIVSIGDPGRQVRMPGGISLTYLGLVLLLPLTTGIAVGMWGLWAKRLWGIIPLGAIMLVYYPLLVGLTVLDQNWGCVGYPRSDELYICNGTATTVSYATQPETVDLIARWFRDTGQRLEPREARMLYRLPMEAPLRIEARDDAGQIVFCREYTPDDIRNLNRNIHLVRGEIYCQ